MACVIHHLICSDPGRPEMREGWMRIGGAGLCCRESKINTFEFRSSRSQLFTLLSVRRQVACIIHQLTVPPDPSSPGVGARGLALLPWCSPRRLESVHPLPDGYRLSRTVRCPGAQCLYVRFDQRCATQYDYDKVRPARAIWTVMGGFRDRQDVKLWWEAPRYGLGTICARHLLTSWSPPPPPPPSSSPSPSSSS